MTAPDVQWEAREALRKYDQSGTDDEWNRALDCVDALRALLASPAPAAASEPVSVPYMLPVEAAEHVRRLVAALGRSDDLTPDEFASLESARRWLASRGGSL